MDALRKNIMMLSDEDDIRTIALKCRVEEDLLIITVNAGEETSIVLCRDVDLFLFDIHMPEMGQGAKVELIQKYDPEMNIVVVGIYPQDDLALISAERFQF